VARGRTVADLEPGIGDDRGGTAQGWPVLGREQAGFFMSALLDDGLDLVAFSRAVQEVKAQVRALPER
jgi:hypothetical protein